MVLNDFVGESEDEQRHILSRAKEKTQGLITLIGDILDLSRMEAGLVLRGSQSVDIKDLLKAIVDFLESKARGKKQTLTLSVPDGDLPPVVADPQALEIVFSNLITNAIHYTGENGAIQVSAEPVNGDLCVVFQDNGFGIEERHQEKIFEKFYRIKNDQTRYITGTGLGLPIVKGIVDALGGRIDLESRAGEGSTFRVFLPTSSGE
jgi:signal transduction histidine kinase